jgi:hypothetical protein
MTNERYRQGKTVKWVLSIIALLGLAMLVIPFLLTPPAYLYLQIKDTVFEDSSFNGKKGEIINKDTEISHPFHIHKFGKDYIARVGRIDSGKTDWQANVEGYHPVDFSVDIPPMQKKTAVVSLKPTFGRLKILGKNAVKPDAPIEAELKVKLGSDEKEISGNPTRGIFVSYLSPGPYTINAVAQGFYPSTKDNLTVNEGETIEVEMPLIPWLKEDEVARIVLTWDKDPNDLDSHLFLPRHGELNTRHVYYPSANMISKKSDAVAAVLDVDDTTSFGPETVTIYKTLDGSYNYAIYHYSGSGSIGSTSKAKIKVITHNNGIQEFSAPSPCEKKWWYVFDLEINGGEVQILPKNECLPQMGWKTGQKESTGNQ